ncbi:hypothetical protein TEA_010499 [Camellia sinensis var. sinensis]|uniref:Uncharacterized protein n=1 Tax=Camellia sinensis var. sinensis TaxID=542762 RepID=A0A4S4ELH5_CAMSN|nr:hypothetical protein TEA_010499 [Camellia sinensis var. sinensis]
MPSNMFVPISQCVTSTKHLAVEKNRTLLIKLYPEISNLTRDSPPIASFIIRVVCSVGDGKSLIHPEITDKKLKNNDDFVWAIEVPLMGKFIIDIEFLDLKIVPLEVSNEVLESGEETYFPALHVGLDNPSAMNGSAAPKSRIPQMVAQTLGFGQNLVLLVIVTAIGEIQRAVQSPLEQGGSIWGQVDFRVGYEGICESKKT